MVDPIETVIAYLLSDSDLNTAVAGQIGGQVNYGSGWVAKSRALLVSPDGGVPQLYLPNQSPRLEFRSYGATARTAYSTYLEIVRITRATVREEVAISGGLSGLLSRFNIASMPSMLYDSELQMFYALFFAEVNISELDV